MTQPVPTPEELAGMVGEAISAVISRSAASMTVKWLGLIETMDSDGLRGLWTLGSDGITAWDSIGMLQYALQREQADIVRTELNTDD